MARRNVVANSGSVKLEGVAELKAALAEIGTQVATQVGRAADRKAAQYVADIMRQTAPYGTKTAIRSRTSKKGVVTRTDYGHLRDNINVRLAKARKETTITYNIGVGAAFWGFFLEFGTRNMGARPWMRPAFDVTVNSALNLQIDGLKSGIERAAKKAAKGVK